MQEQQKDTKDLGMLASVAAPDATVSADSTQDASMTATKAAATTPAALTSLQPPFGKPSIWSNGAQSSGASAGGVPNRFTAALGRRPSAQQQNVPHPSQSASNAAPTKGISNAPPCNTPPDQEISDLAAIWSRVQASQNPFSAGGSSSDALFHRRSSTGPYKAPWETTPHPPSVQHLRPPQAHHHQQPHHQQYHSGVAGFAPIRLGPGFGATATTSQSFLHSRDRYQGPRRFSLSTGLHTGSRMAASGADTFETIGLMRRSGRYASRPSVSVESTQSTGAPMPVRRHSVAGPLAGPLYHAPGRFLSEAFNTLKLDDSVAASSTSQLNGGAANSTNSSGTGLAPVTTMPAGYSSLLEDFEEFLDDSSRRLSIASTSEVGKGIALHSLPHDTKLYIVEFKAGRSDIFYVGEDEPVPHPLGEVNPPTSTKKGDLVIVEADRGRDLGKIINDSITPYQIHMLQAQHSEALNDLHRVNREIHPKRIYRLAEASEVAMLVTKSQDEAKALSVCQTKVRQKKLAMEVVDAEYQWDRRKLTFYFVADRRIDFRELVRDLFKIYKTRIWMCAVNPVTNVPLGPSDAAVESQAKPPTPPPTSSSGPASNIPTAQSTMTAPTPAAQAQTATTTLAPALKKEKTY